MADLTSGLLREGLKVEAYDDSKAEWVRGNIQNIGHYVKYDHDGGKFVSRQDTQKYIKLIETESNDDIFADPESLYAQFKSNKTPNIGASGMLSLKNMVIVCCVQSLPVHIAIASNFRYLFV